MRVRIPLPRSCFQKDLVSATVIMWRCLTLSLGFAWSGFGPWTTAELQAFPSVDVGEEVQRQVEEDWINRERRFRASGNSKELAAADQEFSLVFTRTSLDRAQALADRLQSTWNSAQCEMYFGKLAHFETQLAALEAKKDVDAVARREIYLSTGVLHS